MHETTMRGYEDELQDYDDYEDDQQEEGYGYEEDEGGEYEEDGGEYEEEEPRKPTKEELEYLELRQKLKESIRKKMKKENNIFLADSSARKKQNTHDNYGSFFGPSQPVIAQRVIQESKSLLENQHLVSKLSNSPQISKNTNKAYNGVLKPKAHNQPPRVSEKQVKAEKLKVTRDYSFLLSDDAELPGPSKELPSRNTFLRNSEGQPVQVAGKSKQALSNGGKPLRGSCEDRRFVARASHITPKSGSNYKLSSTGQSSKASVDSRKQLTSNSGNGPGRPVGTKGLPSKMPVNSMANKSLTPGMKNPLNGVQKPLPSKFSSSVSKQSVEQRKYVLKQSVEQRNSVSKQSVVQRKDVREQNKSKVLPKQPMSSSRAQINMPLQTNKPPLKQVPKRSELHDQRPKKVGRRHPDDSVDDMDISSMIRSMFNYNPNKFVDDDDDNNMEAGFDEILAEEKRSALIARKEDEEELRLIEEEEERERRRRAAKLKKRKLGE